MQWNFRIADKVLVLNDNHCVEVQYHWQHYALETTLFQNAVSALVEPNGPMALLHNHDALANIPLANKTPFIHPQLCMNHCRVHQSSCFCLHSPCRILLSPTLLQSKSSLREADRDRENPGLSCILSSPGM